MGDLVGGKVIVFRMLNELSSKPFAMRGFDAIELRKEQDRSVESTGALFVASIENIIDSWGQGVLISEPELELPCGDKTKSVMNTISEITPNPCNFPMTLSQSV